MKKLLLLLSIIISLSGCAGQGADNDKFTIYTSFYAMEQLTGMIAGERVEVESLIPSGAEAHDWEPGTADMVDMSRADVFVYSGMGMEPWAEKIIAAADNPGLIAVEASRGVEPLEVEGNTDPHVWLNPKNAVIMLENITEALASADTENAEYYRSNLETARAELATLDAEFAAAGLAGGEIIVTHGAFGYLADAYGMEQYVIEGISGESDPSSATLRAVIDHLAEKESKSVFYVISESDKVAQTVASESGARVFALDTFGSGDGTGYINVMRKNLEVLKEALNG